MGAGVITVVNEGDQLFHSGKLGENGVSCDQCHPNATNTHPETYPKFQKQIGKVVSLFEMVNWCIRNPLEGKHACRGRPQNDGAPGIHDLRTARC